MADTTTAVYGFTKPEEGGSAGTWDTKLNGDLDSVDAEIARPRLPHNSPAISAGAITLNLALARVFKFTVSEAITSMTISNVPANTFMARIVLVVTNGGAFAITWPGAVTWLSSITPLLKSAGVDVIEMFTVDAGTTWYACLVEDAGAWGSDTSGFLVPKTDATYDIGTGSFRPRDIRASRDVYVGREILAVLGGGTGLGNPVLTFARNVSLSTSSVSEVSLAANVIPGNTLDEDGGVIRVSIVGRTQTQAAVLNVKFGATSCDVTIPADESFEYVVTLVRTGAATQLMYGRLVGSTQSQIRRVAPAETLSGDVTLDVRGSVTSGGTLSVDSAVIDAVVT